MAIPKYDELTWPLLQILKARGPSTTHELAASLAEQFVLSQEEASTRLPSGGQTYLVNRIGWAGFYLQKAGLVKRPRRASWDITSAGEDLLKEPAIKLDRNALLRFASFKDFIQQSRKESSALQVDESSSTSREDETPPDELMAEAHEKLLIQLKQELLETTKQMNPIAFERLVLDVLLAMGYGGSLREAASMTKVSNDEGIDGVINEDRLGLDVIYVQAKRWQQTVGRREIQSFVGALAGQQAHKGIFITTSDFADTAKAYAKSISQKVILIDGDRLAALMVDYNVGVSSVHSYEIKRIDSDYFSEI